MASSGTYLNEVEGEGGKRPIAARWVVRGTIVMRSPAQFGGNPENAAVDAVILRDTVSQNPLLPGPSIAGALRNYLADVAGGYYSSENEIVSSLFGSMKEDDEGSQSPLIVFDSIGKMKDPIEIRDGVAIDAATGIAAKHKKFDQEILPADTEFPFRIELIIPSEGEEAELLSYLLTTLKGLESGEIRLGAHKTRGLGRCSVIDWRVKRFDLQTKKGWLDWLKTNHERPLRGIEASNNIAEALEKEFASHIELLTDERQLVRFTLKLQLNGGILIRSPGRNATDPDSIHLKSRGQSIISGTSMAGVLRNQVLKIAKTIHPEKANAWVNGFFGEQHGSDERDKKETRASRVIVSESTIESGKRLQPSRIRIDRFTGGVIEGALFTEEPHYGGSVQVDVEVRNPHESEIGVLLLALRDIITGDVPIGGSSSVGRGFVQGSIIIRGLQVNDTTLETIEIRPDKKCQYSTELNNFVSAFLKSSPPQESQEDSH